jgi:hypothetical protein
MTVLPLCLYGCEIGVILRKEHTLKVLNNEVLRRVFGNTETIKERWITIHVLY